MAQVQVQVQDQVQVWAAQLTKPWGASGMSEEKKVLKKTQAVHIAEVWCGGTRTALIGSSSAAGGGGGSVPCIWFSSWEKQSM